MTDYQFDSILVADPVTFQRAPNASVLVYDAADTGNSAPLELKDLNGLPLPNPLTSSTDAFLPAFAAPVPQVKLVAGGLTVTASSYKGLLENVAEALAAALAASGATDEQISQAIATAGSQTHTALVQRFVAIPAGITDGQVPVWDATAGKFVPGTGRVGGGGGSVSFVTLIDVGQAVEIPAGAVVGIALVQGAGGGKTASWPAMVKWDGGVAPVLQTGAGAIDLFTFVQNPAGGWLGTRAGAFEGPDTVAPTAPTNLVAGATTKTSIPLSWTAANDAGSGIGGYEYRVNGGTWSATGSTGTTFTVTGLTANTSYTLEVRAFDTVGNRGSAASVTSSTQAAPTYQQLLASTKPTVWLKLDGDITNAGTDTSLSWAAPSGLAWGAGLDGGTGSADFTKASGPVKAGTNGVTQGMSGASACTVTFLYKPTVGGIATNPFSTMGAAVMQVNSLNKIEATLFDSAGTQHRITSNPLTIGTVHHVALTYDGTQSRLYINGTMVGSTAMTGPVKTGTPWILVGAWGTDSLVVKGLVDSPAIHRDAVLTAAQILELAQAAGAA